MINYRILIFCLIFSSLVAVNSYANNDQEITITSDYLKIIKSKNKAIFTGNVTAKKDDMLIETNEMIVKYEADKNRKKTRIKKIFAIGNVKIKTAKELAYGDRAEYDVQKSTITLYNNVKLIQDKNVILANKVVFDRLAGKVNILSDKEKKQDSKRVKALINSDPNKP